MLARARVAAGRPRAAVLAHGLLRVGVSVLTAPVRPRVWTRAASSLPEGLLAAASLAVGGAASAAAEGARPKLLEHPYEYDLVVVGGGSGGLAAAREASLLGARVALLDYVDPSPQGSRWGLGGTCVNVGCIPKKLMHQAALHGQGLHDAREYGWDAPEKVAHSWERLVENVQNYIKGTNWGYKNVLREEHVEYINAKGRFLVPEDGVEGADTHTIRCTFKNGKTRDISAAHVLVAVGGRPTVPKDVPGAREYAITSDDLFMLPRPPGRTLVVGAGYVALECAGFLTELGYPTTVLVRGKVLRGFDREMADRIAAYMEETGTRIEKPAMPVRIRPAKGAGAAGAEEGAEVGAGAGVEGAGVEGGPFLVTWRAGKGDEVTEEFDTVVFATGRHAVTRSLRLDAVGIATDSHGKIMGGSSPTSSETTPAHAHVHAVGDVLAGTPELTPVAIRAGHLLARRLFAAAAAAKGTATDAAHRRPWADGTETMDYSLVPTTVFTPLEYACVGLTEEQAVEQRGADAIEVYHLQYETLEMSGAHRVSPRSGAPLATPCYTKLICERTGAQRVLGLHVLGPGAGEVMQGFAVAVRMGATKRDLEATVGIHPTHAEEVVTLDRTKRSGVKYVKTSC